MKQLIFFTFSVMKQPIKADALAIETKTGSNPSSKYAHATEPKKVIPEMYFIANFFTEFPNLYNTRLRG
ncbi:hypothetical protein RUK98_003569 [Vibrio cholerae]|nr:hypothetical protein [Vibrio cholerae]HDZ9198906.1 hypothetical protein [Vibrio cholerae]